MSITPQQTLPQHLAMRMGLLQVYGGAARDLKREGERAAAAFGADDAELRAVQRAEQILRHVEMLGRRVSCMGRNPVRRAEQGRRKGRGGEALAEGRRRRR
jgi:hypothetical protein